MKKRIALITLALVFGLFCTTLTWAGNGNGKGLGMKDGSMLDQDLSNTTTITGTVFSSGVAGSGLTIDEGDGEFITVYGMGPLSYWDSLKVAKPTVGEEVEIEALDVTFSDGSIRLIAVSLTIGETFIPLRTDDGRPAWRGLNKKGQGSGNNDGSGGRGNGSCDGTGACPLTAN